MTLWEPLRMHQLHRLRRDMDQLFDTVALPSSRTSGFLPGAGARQYPRINLAETPDGYVAEALAPGVEPASFGVTVKENVLTISGDKAAPQGVPTEAFHRNERAGGRFSRSIELPAEVAAEKVSAAYRDGILTVTLPKAPQAKPRRIEIATA